MTKKQVMEKREKRHLKIKKERKKFK